MKSFGLIKAVVCVGGMLSTVSAFGVKTLPPVFAPRVHDVRRSAPSLKLQPPGPTARRPSALSPRSSKQSYAPHILTTSLFLGGLAVAAPAAHAAADPVSMTAFLDSTLGPGFVQAFSLIFVSELGDKTFFIAALLSAKFSRVISFVGAVGALVVMTGISVGIGQVFHAVPEGLTRGLPIDDYLACAAFAYFGYRTLSEALAMGDGEKGGELEDAEEALAELGEDDAQDGMLAKLRKSGAIALVGQTFALVFAAEFGDRSFLSTIALAAAQNPVSVATGAIVAHVVATAGAVAGGAILSDYISEKVMGYIGGSLFIVFALTTAIGFF